MKSLLPPEEEDALKRILRHHEVELAPKLVNDLGALLNWVHQLEQAKAWSANPKPPYMLAFLSTLGIYGAEAINATGAPPAGDS